MRPAPVVVVAVVVVLFLGIGAYLLFGRGGGGAAQARTFDVTVSGNTMSPSQIAVHEGDHVTLSFTIDKPEEVHLHGYDIMFAAEQPGEKVTKTFTADKTGSFDIEIEQTSTQIGSLRVDPR
jgi:Cupredoxin-like domain